MKGSMAALQEPMDKSREIYRATRTVLEALSGFSDLLEFTQLLPKDAVQASDDFDTVYAQASEAQAVLLKAVAEHWESDPDPKLSFLKHAVKGTTTAEWIEMADSPGVKGSKRAKEKMANDYDGHANKLKDLARLTLRFTQPDKLATALRELKSLGFKIVILKNKYASPTPMGYCDFNLVVAIVLENFGAMSAERHEPVRLQPRRQVDVDAGQHDVGQHRLARCARHSPGEFPAAPNSDTTFPGLAQHSPGEILTAPSVTNHDERVRNLGPLRHT